MSVERPRETERLSTLEETKRGNYEYPQQRFGRRIIFYLINFEGIRVIQEKEKDQDREEEDHHELMNKIQIIIKIWINT